LADFLETEAASYTGELAEQAGRRLAARLKRERQVGDLLRLDYDEAVMVVHDHLRRNVGGLPLGCFLIATRVAPGSSPNPGEEDTSLVLLRVLGPTQLPNHTEADRDRFEAAKRAADRDEQWDDQTTTDQFTLNLLRFAGMRCRVLGTFLLKPGDGDWGLHFGPDLSNFYSGRGMKVYKPDSETLSDIVNFVRVYGQQASSGNRIRIGRVRYAASERPGDELEAVEVHVDPRDLLARRTALFGMSRTGKSNTTKIVATAVFRLRNPGEGGVRVGQLIIDPNGEYANDNVQDAGSIRGVAGITPGAKTGDVVTYGLHAHPNDPGRRIIKLNFFGNEPRNWRNRDEVTEAMTALVEGKVMLDGLLAGQTAQYISAFRNLRMDVPPDWDESARTRYMRRVCAYRAVLSEHLQPPASIAMADVAGLTNADLRAALAKDNEYASVAATFKAGRTHWDQVRTVWRKLLEAIKDKESVYGQFNREYAEHHDGREWHDTELTTLLAFLSQPGGMRLVSGLKDYHSPDTTSDYADDVVADLRDGRLVIIDQSTGDPEINTQAAERLMWRVFDRQKEDFISPKVNQKTKEIIPPPDVLVYVEEAHNLLPAKSDDLRAIWSRVAKEGSKFRIGLVYATQEPSSIQPNILKNTDNWFIAHLNNSDELRELKKYYDFEDFSRQILAVPEPGFLKMRTLSNPYTVPVQVDRFQVGR
jgi:hypothetical protein